MIRVGAVREGLRALLVAEGEIASRFLQKVVMNELVLEGESAAES